MQIRFPATVVGIIQIFRHIEITDELLVPAEVESWAHLRDGVDTEKEKNILPLFKIEA
jgi:hypothetical protein